MRGMKYKDIAAKYGVSINTVKSWKRRYGWERKSAPKRKKEGRTGSTQRSAPKNAHKEEDEKREQREEKHKFCAAAIEDADLNDKQRLFCIFYLSSHNALISYKRAYKCSYQAAASSAYRLLGNARVRDFIKEMKDDRDRDLLIRATDVVDMYMRIAFANINNFVMMKGGKMHIAESDDIDGQIVQEIKPVKGGGIAVRLADRMKALQWLSDYFNLNPKDRHRQEYDEKMLELKERKIEVEEF